MTPKQTIKLLETEFKQKVDIVTSPTFSSKSVEDKIAELAKMYKAGQNIQRLLNDGKGLTADEVKQYRGRVLTGFKKLNAIIRSISSELAAEEDAISMVKTKAVTQVSESIGGFVKSYKVEKLDADGNTLKTFIRDFTDMDANSVKTSLNQDGEMVIDAAQRKIDILNGESSRKKLNFVYSLVPKSSVKENNMRTMYMANMKIARELIEHFGMMVAAAQNSCFYLDGPKPTLKDIVETIENINVSGDRTYKLKTTFTYEDIKDLSLISWAMRFGDQYLQGDIISDLNKEYGSGSPKFMPSEYLHKCYQYFPTMADNCVQALSYKNAEDKKRESNSSSINYRGTTVSESKDNYVKSYKTEFTGPDGVTREYIQNFTQIQANSVHAYLYKDGIPYVAAKKLVDEWNRINKVQKSNYKYSLV